MRAPFKYLFYLVDRAQNNLVIIAQIASTVLEIQPVVRKKYNEVILIGYRFFY